MFILDSLQSLANDIQDTIDVDTILPVMVQQGLLTPSQCQDLSSPYHTPVAKQQKLFIIIIGLPEKCVSQFIHCLHETSNYEPHRKLHDELLKLCC